MQTSIKSPSITAYLKPTCGWSQGVRAVLNKYQLPYQDQDIVNNPMLYLEMVERSRQTLSPCVVVNGHMLADVSGDEVEAYLLREGLVQPTNTVAEQPAEEGCEEHCRC